MKSIRPIITRQNACRRLSSTGDFSTAFGLRPLSGRNDIVKPNIHAVISSDSREIPCDRNVNTRTRPHQILARRGSLPPAHSPAVAHRREIPYCKNGTKRTRASPLARRGSLPPAAEPPQGGRLKQTLYFFRGGFLHCVRTSSSLRSK